MEEKIAAELKQALLERNQIKVSTLRLLISELKYASIHKNSTLTESEVISVIQKELKKRKEAAFGFRQGGREESALKEESEAEILSEYLPTQLSDEELINVVKQIISEASLRQSAGVNEVVTKKDLHIGKIIGIVMSKVGNRADGGRVSKIAKELLAD